MIEFKKLAKTKEHYEMKHKWLCDETINYLFTPQFFPKKITPPSLEEMMDSFYEKDTTYNFMIYLDSEIIGDLQIDYDFDMLYKKVPTAWIGITIGEASQRGKGIGKEVMEFAKNHAKNKGFNRIELGVFSFNHKAIAFYEKLGYKRIGEIKGFTYYDGKYYSDYRYELSI